MSCSYEITARIHGANPDRAKAIKEAAEGEWEFIDWYPIGYPDDSRSFASTGTDNLYGGETEEEFARRLTKAIWKANGSYCEVWVQALCLEHLPHESYVLDEDEYEELVGEPPGDPGLADAPNG